MKDKQQNILIIGAGLCGSLLALRLGQRGYNVNVYEMRPDLRKVDVSAGRSINLAFSDRGNKAMKLVGIEDKVKTLCIPMNGRMLHDIEGNTMLSNYSGREHEYINSISRGQLNALLLDEAENLPKQFNVYGEEEALSSVKAQLPELLSGVAEFHATTYWQLIEQGVKQAQPSPAPINLLQGIFAPSLPWNKWWQQWRIVAVAVAVVCVVQFVAVYTELSVLESKNVELRAEIERSYREAIPRGAVVDPEKQLRRKVSNLKGSSGDGFVALFDKVGSVIATVDGLSLQSLNYSGKDSEIRLTILAAGFNDVETTRSKLEALGLTAVLTGSNAEGNKTRARLKIKG